MTIKFNNSNLKKIFFILSLIGILILILIGNLTKEFRIGTIEKIATSSSKTTISIKENNIQLIIFDKISNLQKRDKIEFCGQSEIYREQEQIIVDSIKRLKL